LKNIMGNLMNKKLKSLYQLIYSIAITTLWDIPKKLKIKNITAVGGIPLWRDILKCKNGFDSRYIGSLQLVFDF
ncbi:hypothetical protein CH333_03965, partial [candidate division WOR-3 bacterium JGI_Cruoil_03_44_89]